MACMCSVLYKTADEQLFPGVCAVYTVLYVEHIPAIVHQHIPAYQHTSTYACMYTVLYIIYIHTPAPEQNLFPPQSSDVFVLMQICSLPLAWRNAAVTCRRQSVSFWLASKP